MNLGWRVPWPRVGISRFPHPNLSGAHDVGSQSFGCKLRILFLVNSKQPTRASLGKRVSHYILADFSTNRANRAPSHLPKGLGILSRFLFEHPQFRFTSIFMAGLRIIASNPLSQNLARDRKPFSLQPSVLSLQSRQQYGFYLLNVHSWIPLFLSATRALARSWLFWFLRNSGVRVIGRLPKLV
jgi:hypothetical protein